MKPQIYVPRIACILATLLLVLVSGCSGGDGPVAPNLVVGSITGPGTFSEVECPTFTIETHGDNSATCEWSVNPENAGWFTTLSPFSVTFRPAEIENDLAAEIGVTVTPLFGDPVERTFDIVIENDTTVAGAQLNVSEIIGPSTIPGGSWVSFGIETSGDTGVTCLWTVEPPDVGTITHPDSRYTNFAAFEVQTDTPALIRVTVESDNSPPVTKTQAINIVPGQPAENGLVVSAISGPTTIIECEPAPYVAAASGDTGISYEWSVNPPEAGYFSHPTSPATDFTPEFADQLIVYPFHAVISVSVVSDNHTPVVKTKDVKVVNLDQLVSWIESPTKVIENMSETYIINTDPFFDPILDEPMPLRWEVEPIYAGVFVVSSSFPPYEDYFISSCYTPEVIFKASEVPYDFPAKISVFYHEQQEDGSMLKKLIDTVDITILNDYAKPPDDHWAVASAIMGPTEMVETVTDVFYYGLPDLDPDFDYKWSIAIIDDWANGMPFFDDPPAPYPGTVQPTRGEDGRWTWHTVEVIFNNFEMASWLELSVECETGTETFIICLLPIPQPCAFTTEIWKPRVHSGYEDPTLLEPIEPLEPWFDQPIFEPYGEWQLRSGDTVRMFALTDSYFSGDYLRVKWETEPPGAVHFIGDAPFIYDPEIEIQWIEDIDKYCDPIYPMLCGSHYYLDGGSMTIVVWAEMKVLTSSMFDLVLTVDTIDCDEAIRVVRFNK